MTDVKKLRLLSSITAVITVPGTVLRKKVKIKLDLYSIYVVYYSIRNDRRFIYDGWWFFVLLFIVISHHPNN